MSVDNAMDEPLRINFNITFHQINCKAAQIDAMDVAGDQHLGLEHDVFKIRLDKDGHHITQKFREHITALKVGGGADCAARPSADR